MSDYCYSYPVFQRVLDQAAQMDRMIARIEVGPAVAVRVDNGMAWYEARTRCLECRSSEDCRAWLDRTAAREASGGAAFCPNSAFFGACKSQEPKGGPTN